MRYYIVSNLQKKATPFIDACRIASLFPDKKILHYLNLYSGNIVGSYSQSGGAIGNMEYTTSRSDVNDENAPESSPDTDEGND